MQTTGKEVVFMLKKITSSIILFFIVGCGTATDNTSMEENHIQQQSIRYEAPQKEVQKKDYYTDARELQKDKLSDNDFQDYTDPYTNEESQKVAKELMKNRDIILAEVRSMDEQIFVAVKLRENNYDRNHDMGVVADIEDDVRRIIKNDDKQITVLTDHIQWNRLKNHHASPKGLIDEDENFFDDFFVSFSI